MSYDVPINASAYIIIELAWLFYDLLNTTVNKILHVLSNLFFDVSEAKMCHIISTVIGLWNTFTISTSFLMVLINDKRFCASKNISYMYVMCVDPETIIVLGEVWTSYAWHRCSVCLCIYPCLKGELYGITIPKTKYQWLTDWLSMSQFIMVLS